MLISRSAKKLLLALIFLTALLTSHAVFAFGALAIDEHKGDQYGWAIDYKNYDEAQKRAMKECGDGCRIVFIFNNGAAAYASDQTPGSTIYGWGRASTGAEAKAIALSEARKKGAKQPIIRAWGEESKSYELVTYATKEEHEIKKEFEAQRDVSTTAENQDNSSMKNPTPLPDFHITNKCKYKIKAVILYRSKNSADRQTVSMQLNPGDSRLEKEIIDSRLLLQMPKFDRFYHAKATNRRGLEWAGKHKHTIGNTIFSMAKHSGDDNELNFLCPGF